MTEKGIEAYIRQRVKTVGGKAYKFVSPGNNGVPDRIIVFPGGRICFAEMKAPGKVSTQQQQNRQRELRTLGCRVYADVDSCAKVDALLEDMRHEV